MRLKRWLRQFTHLSTQQRSVIGLLLLLVASFGGNWIRWTLFFNIDFIFGSIAVWLVMYLYGWRWGALAGLVNGIATYFLWLHPYTAVTFTAEAVVVGWLFHRYRQNVVLLNGVFWLTLGMPLVCCFYGGILRLEPGQVLIIILKQPVNAILNALIASLLITHVPIHHWLQRPRAIRTLSFRQTLFNLLVAFVFLPTLLLIVLASRDVVDDITTEAQVGLSRASEQTVTELQYWYQEHLRSIHELADQTVLFNSKQSKFLQQHVELTQRLLTDFSSINIFDASGTRVLASTMQVPEAIASGARSQERQVVCRTQQPTFSDPLPERRLPTVKWIFPIVRDKQCEGLIESEISLYKIDSLLKQRRRGDSALHMTLIGRNQVVIASTQSDRPAGQRFDLRHNGDLQWLGPQTYQWFPNRGRPLVMTRWINSYFVQEVPLTAHGLPWMLVIESSAMPDVQHIQRIYSRNLALILAIAILALISAALISRQLVHPLTQLATVTTNLPSKLLAGQPIQWTDSPITEIAFLVENFRSMAATLTQQFREIQQALDYEALLKRITDNVRDSLDEAQILQTAVSSLGRGLGVICCDAAIYNAEQTLSTIQYEYTTLLPSAQGQSFQIPEQFPGIHSALLQGDYRQFCFNVAVDGRPMDKAAAIFACPIVDDQGVLGDLWLFKPRQAMFDDLEIRLVQQVANQCAIALRQARLYQAAQVQVKALEELNYLKDDFLSTVSHELRTPITNIKMALKMLQLSNRDDQRERYVNILQSECDREAELINDLLDLQRLAAGTKDLNLEPIELKEWVTHVVEAFHERTRHREQILHIEISAELPTLTSDPACLERILTELLNNACKYTPPGEQIWVSARTVHQLYQEETTSPDPHTMIPYAPMFVLNVCNFGVEIPPTELKHIFEKFYRIPGGDRWKQGGTGLGLALVQKMTEHLGGSIHVESAQKRTCFTVKLPLDPNVN
ncbi:MAG: ATP-binding protein [Leptolyngbyaceae cyanobacterium bins.349]|nr:ATP-binding protein [Leptolyngbyaceae cyanobacterium bins.349]